MTEKIQYFICNKASDYERGYLEHMDILEHGICPERDSGKKGIFLSQVYDSQWSEMRWHRLRIATGGQGEARFRLSVYAGGEKHFLFQGEEVELEDFLRRKDVHIEEKKACLSPWLQKQVTGETDILLHEVRGRYLWFLIEMYGMQYVEKISDICISFPGQSWTGYLPEVYQREDAEQFLDRYLGIFQTIYEDINQWLRGVAANFDVETAPGEMLAELASWVGIENTYIWKEEILRRFLAEGVSLYKRRGTRQGLARFIALYTGEIPYIVEHHQILPFRKEPGRFQVLKKLYGSSPYVFTVLLREKIVGAPRQQKALVRLIEQLKPAHMETKIVFMKPNLFVEQYSYLGINSVLGTYGSPVLDGHGALPFVVLEERRRQI